MAAEAAVENESASNKAESIFIGIPFHQPVSRQRNGNPKREQTLLW
jgi:hypothetical protein